MAEESVIKAPKVTVIGGVIGGALAIVGSLLPWEASRPVGDFAKLLKTSFRSGFSSNGKFALIGGLVALACGLLMLVGKPAIETRALAVLVVLGGLVVLLLSGLALVRGDEGTGLQMVFTDSATGEELRGSFESSSAYGLYLAAAGGVIAVVGGVAGLARKPRPPQD